MTEKITEFQKTIRARDKKILERYTELISDGYMKTQALKQLAEEFGLFSVAGVNRIIKKYTRQK